ncbi:energy-coupling factor ABC transporter ATP-binding protein [Fusobacterium polymorphum]|uniref:ATP-binding cassette domain-containing protein n=1 Tax=Fusobacterium nucleatum subsp. polymorphum TaxID=76857 RepID=UPI003256996A
MKISLKNIGYEYPTFENNKNGIYDVSLEIDSHRRIAIVGHTGSGKSTLLKLIKGLLKKQMGEINIDGKIEDIGYIFQYPEHQIFETVIFKDISYGLKKLNEKEILERVEKVLELVGLDKDYLHHSTLNLSGGEKRRVALAGVLIMQPQLLLLDEATVGLDPEGKEQLFKILLDWQKEDNKSFLFITHDMNDVLEYAEEVIVMDKGKLLYHTSPSDLFEKYSDKLQSLGLELPECISFLNKLNQKLKKPIKISEDIKEESILKVIEEKIKYKRNEQ